jgi:hypothetical protein
MGWGIYLSPFIIELKEGRNKYSTVASESKCDWSACESCLWKAVAPWEEVSARDQESLLTNLHLSLNLSNEEHLLELRRLCSTQAT